MPGADRTVAVELLARVSGYTAGMRDAARATDQTAASMSAAAKAQTELEAAQKRATAATTALGRAQAEQAASSRRQLDAISTVGKGFLTFGAVAGIGFGLAVKASLDFNKQMALVGTLAKASPAQLNALSTAALNVGQKYGYTATQVAQAQAELVKAGLSVSQVLGGALTGALTLAAAAQTDVGTATEIAVSAMTQFGLHASAVPHIADLLAAGADKALGSAVDLGLGLSQVGTTAHQFGESLDSTVAVLAEFANHGQIGQKAGTELNQALLQLAAPTKQATQLMDHYGLSVYQANGHFVTFAELADRLQKSFGGLTDAQRNQALAVIFGSRAVRAANILYQDGAAGVLTWEQKVQDAGFAAGQASGKLNSLSGDLQKLKAAFETGLIETGNEATSSLRGIVQGLTAVVQWYDRLGPVAKTAIFDTTAVATVFGLAGGAALIAVPKIVAFQAALATLRGTAASTTVALDAEAASAAAAGNAGAAAGAKGLLGRAAGAAGGAGPVGLIAGALLVGTGVAVTADNSERAGEVKSAATNPSVLAADRARLAQLQAQAATPSRVPTRFGGAGASSGTAAEISRLKGIINDATAAMKENKKATDAAANSNDTLVTTLNVVGTSLIRTQFDLTAFGHQLDALSHTFDVQGLTDQLTEGFKALAKQVDKSGGAMKGNSTAALANRDAMRQQFGVAVNLIKAYADQTDASGNLVHSADQVKAKATQVATSFQHQATKAGINKHAVQTYVDALKTVPGTVNTDVTTTGVADAISKIQAYRVYLDKLPAVVSTQVNAQINFNSANLPGAGVLTGPPHATGGRLYGPGTGTSDSMLIRASTGEYIVNARATRRNLALLEKMNRGTPAFAHGGRVGGLPAFASGGLVDANLSDIFSLLGNVSRSDAKQTLAKADASLASAEATLERLRKSNKTTTQQLAAAEDRIGVARTTRANAARAYRVASQPIGLQFAAAASRQVTTDGAFIHNLTALADKGFGFLAMQLLDAGDANAKTIAAQAVHWSNSQLRATQAKLQQSSAQQKQLGLLPAELAISSALRTGKNPTLASIAASSGIDPSELQAGLIAMQRQLKGNRNAGALLSGLNSTGVYATTNWGQTSAQAGPLFQIDIHDPVTNPLSTGEKIAIGAQRVLAVSGGSTTMPRW